MYCAFFAAAAPSGPQAARRCPVSTPATALGALGALVALGALLAVAGCGGNKVQPGTDLQPDALQPDVLSPFDKGPSPCGAGIYPCAPYGTKNGAIADNLDFQGFKDPQEQCKANKDKVLDLDNRVKVSFKDFYLGDPGCTKRGLLWVMVSAGWCGPCVKEVTATAQQYKAGAVDARVAILNILFENDKLGVPISEDFLKRWITSLSDPTSGKPIGSIAFPVVMDPQFTMGVYFNKSSVPFNMLIDTSTMKIYWQDVGEKLPEIGQQITNFFK